MSPASSDTSRAHVFRQKKFENLVNSREEDAMATSAVSKAATRSVPPSSAFSELLHRSKFSSYDPAISQTYTAPPSYTHRGNYGLKRAIPMRRKDSYISLASFEHPASFTEWNNAEQQVKFVKRVEEMNVTPSSHHNSSWTRGLGDARTQWLIDSEFAEHDYDKKVVYELSHSDETDSDSADTHSETLEGHGNRGPGAYGSRRAPPQSAEPISFDIQPNIDSMSPAQFKRYLAHLRTLQPKFQGYLAEQHAERATTRDSILESQSELDKEIPLYVASQNPFHRLHRRFLSKHTTDAFNELNKIQPRPHRFGGLMYSRPSILETVMSTDPQPGLVWQNSPKYDGRFQKANKESFGHGYIALFGGIAAQLKDIHSGTNLPLYDPDAIEPISSSTSTSTSTSISSSISNSNSKLLHLALQGNNQDSTIDDSTSNFRMTRLVVENPPKIVSYAASKSLPKELMETVKVIAEVATDLPRSRRNTENPYKPGSYEYVTHEKLMISRYMTRQRSAGMLNVAALSPSFSRYQKSVEVGKARAALRNVQESPDYVGKKATATAILNSLKGIVTATKVEDDDL